MTGIEVLVVLLVTRFIIHVLGSLLRSVSRSFSEWGFRVRTHIIYPFETAETRPSFFRSFPHQLACPARQSIIMLYTWLIYIKWNGTLLNRMGVWGSEECLPETDFCYWPSDGHNISLSLDASSSRLLCFAVAGKSTLHHPSSQSVSLTFDPSSMVTYYVSISWATQGE